MTTPVDATGGEEQEAALVEIRRGRASERFRAREAPADVGPTVIVSRGLLGSRDQTGKPQTTRERTIAGDLPNWEPLPPGEILVRRPGGA